MFDVTTNKMTIDYDVLMQGLLQVMEARKETAAWANAEGMTLLKDWCTVGICTPRQTGRTQWALKRLVENERAIMVVNNLPLKQAMAGNY